MNIHDELRIRQLKHDPPNLSQMRLWLLKKWKHKDRPDCDCGECIMFIETLQLFCDYEMLLKNEAKPAGKR